MIDSQNPPSLSIVIPTYNNAATISTTLDSIISQKYPQLEIIIIDGGSKDRTLEIIKDDYKQIIKIEYMKGFNLYKMYNRGILLASSHYISFLLPGDLYLSNDVLWHLGELSIIHEFPHLIYGGCLIRDPRLEPQVVIRELSEKALRQGFFPSSLQACWFSVDMIETIGKFNSQLSCKGSFDLFCRIAERRDLSVISTKQILVDYDRRKWSARLLLQESFETMLVIKRHYGLRAAFSWMLHKNPWILIKQLKATISDSFDNHN